MNTEQKIATNKMNEIKKELKTVTINEKIATCKIKEYEEFLNTRTTLSNIEKTDYITTLQSEIANIK